MILKRYGVVVETSDAMKIERLQADGFEELGTTSYKKEDKVIDKDPDTGNKIENPPSDSVDVESHPMYSELIIDDIKKMLDDQKIKYQASATKSTLFQTLIDNQLI